MRHLVVAFQVGHKEHVAEAVIQFHLRGGEVVRAYAEIGGEETLYVSFTLYQATHGGVVLVGTGDEFEGFAPLTYLYRKNKETHRK